jgi:hypothetical protein
LSNALSIRAANQQGHGDIFQGRKLGQQVMELIDESEMAVSPVAPFNLAH